MSRIAYVNGQFVPHSQATTHIEDRGYQFADGIYEVIAVVGNKLIDAQAHLDRLRYSLQELQINFCLSNPTLMILMRELLKRNRVKEGMVYLQITRGVAPRAHQFPENATPVLSLTCRHFDQQHFLDSKKAGVKVITLADHRWKRPNIKSVSLLANILAKQQATTQGAYEAILIDEEGFITEASTANVWIVNHRDQVFTTPASHKILNGITRQRLLSLCETLNIKVTETAFSLRELQQAKEVMLSSSVAGILSVTSIDNSPVGNGQAGPIAAQLRDAYIRFTKQ